MPDEIVLAQNYAISLLYRRRYGEARDIFGDLIPVARRRLGPEAITTLKLRGLYARTLFEADGASHADVLQAITLLEDASRIVKRVFGPSHPLMGLFQDALDRAKQIKKLKAKLGWLDVS